MNWSPIAKLKNASHGLESRKKRLSIYYDFDSMLADFVQILIGRKHSVWGYWYVIVPSTKKKKKSVQKLFWNPDVVNYYNRNLSIFQRRAPYFADPVWSVMSSSVHSINPQIPSLFICSFPLWSDTKCRTGSILGFPPFWIHHCFLSMHFVVCVFMCTIICKLYKYEHDTFVLYVTPFCFHIQIWT